MQGINTKILTRKTLNHKDLLRIKKNTRMSMFERYL